jgi:hypothetical protein
LYSILICLINVFANKLFAVDFMMNSGKRKNKKNVTPDVVNKSIMEESNEEIQKPVDSIEDFIELKRLQNRILGKMIDTLKLPDKPEKINQ